MSENTVAMPRTSKPFWHSPAWVTAMVGLVTALLTIPNVVGDYLSKKQELELLVKKTELAQLRNADVEKTNLFKALVTTLSHRDEDRAMTLRFIAKTHDNQTIRQWAEQELTLNARRPAQD